MHNKEPVYNKHSKYLNNQLQTSEKYA